MQEKNLKFIKLIDKFMPILLLYLALFVKLNVVRADEGSLGEGGSPATFQSCGSQFSGCMGVYGWQFSIVKYNDKTKKYTYVTQSISQSNQQYKWDTAWDEVQKEIMQENSALLSKILAETGVSKADFTNPSNNYYIKAEPRFRVWYDMENGGSCDYNSNEACNNDDVLVTGLASEVAQKIAEKYPIRNIYSMEGKNSGAALQGLSGVTHILACTVRLSDPRNFCFEDNNVVIRDCVECKKKSNQYLAAVYSGIKVGGPKYNNTINYPGGTNQFYSSDYAVGYIWSRDIPNYNKGSILITKTDSDTGSVISGIKFYLDGTSYSCTTGQNGKCSINDVPYGKYTLKEDASSANQKGYLGNFSKSIEVNDKVVTINVTNQKSCSAEFNLYKNNKSERIRMYQYYKGKGYNYNGLLNFGLSNAADACKQVTCNYSPTIGCLSGNYNNNQFNSNNLSCYNETKEINGITGYCFTSFSLINNLGSSSFTSKAGKMYIQKNDPLAATGTVNQKCYFASNPGTISNTYINYISSLKFENSFLTMKNKANNGFILSYNASTGLYEGQESMEYNLPEVYAHNGSGEYSNTKCTNCKFLGYGFVSQFTSNKTNINIPFYISSKFNKTGQISPTFINNFGLGSTGDCKYTIIPEIVLPNEDKLNLEFRGVEAKEPFPGQSGNTRDPGSNWSVKSLDTNNDGVIDDKDLLALRNNTIQYNQKYDINKDGQIDNNIIGVIDIYVNTGKDVYGQMILQTKPNGHGYVPSDSSKTQVTPKYTIILTPETIKKVRKYNKDRNYDDYTLKCDDDGYNCKSTFLRENPTIWNSSNLTIR